jgi:hypothetical protein
MLLKVLSDYVEPTFEELLDAYKIEAKTSVSDTEDPKVEAEDDTEDDEDLFVSSSSSATVKDPSEVRSAISAAISAL